MNADFALLAEGLGAGPAPAGWRPITDTHLLILVGLTGAGKSATVDALRARKGPLPLLPNRRKLADLLVIPTVQRWDGEEPRPVADRRRRFEFTARYRQRFPGGLAHALGRLVLQKQGGADRGLLLFDGLRGADEVTYAAQSLPLARFAVLSAPDVVRVERLLRRKDAFDQVEQTVSRREFRWEEIDGGGALFSHAQRVRLAGLVRRGEVDEAELAAKIAIVAAERRNYDQRAAVDVLRRRAPDRTVVVDTTAHSPTEVAALIDRTMAAAGAKPAGVAVAGKRKLKTRKRR